MGLLIAIAVLAAVAYLVSIRRHPRRRCRACKGTGRHFGAVWKYGHRACTSCGGNGWRARGGVKTFHRTAKNWGERTPEQAAAERAKNFGR